MRGRRGLRLSSGWGAVGLTALLSLLLCGIAYAITICGSCGYESRDDARFCSHCGGQLKSGSVTPRPAPEVPKPDAGEPKKPVEVPKADSDALISPDAVVEDMRTARVQLEAERVVLARMFARNALALNLLAGDDPGEARSKAILDFLGKCDRLTGLVRRKCTACEGTGRAVMSAYSLDGSTTDLTVTGRMCAQCKGVGIVRGRETVDERKYRQGQANDKYQTVQQSRGRLPVGLAWVPADCVEKLDVQETVKLKRAIPPACSRCSGVGRDDCSDCRGTGQVKCEGDDCERGWVERESLGGRIGGYRSEGKSIHKVRCDVCKGTGLDRCEDCSGTGTFLCKTCNGEGFAKQCSKCGGAGLATCRRCSGSRVYRGVECTYCRGEGVSECSSCGGTGRKR